MAGLRIATLRGAVMFAIGIFCMVLGPIVLRTGYDEAFQPIHPGRCKEMQATVASRHRTPSLLRTGNVVVTFNYNPDSNNNNNNNTSSSSLASRDCTVALHNWWPDREADTYYPTGDVETIYDCSYSTVMQCETTESLSYRALVGMLLIALGTLLWAVLAIEVAILMHQAQQEPSTRATTSQRGRLAGLDLLEGEDDGTGFEDAPPI